MEVFAVWIKLKANGQEPITESSLYLLVCDFQLSGTLFPNFIFASDNTHHTTRTVDRRRRDPRSVPVLHALGWRRPRLRNILVGQLQSHTTSAFLNSAISLSPYPISLSTSSVCSPSAAARLRMPPGVADNRTAVSASGTGFGGPRGSATFHNFPAFSCRSSS